MVKDKKLGPRERTFCLLYLKTGDAVKAVKGAGYKGNLEKRAQQFLTRDDIRQEILSLCEFKKTVARESARWGFERLAFGSIEDAVALLYMENPTRQELQDMELFCVSEIKRHKDKSMEIKFFDRLKALQNLFDGQDDTEKEGSASPVFEAIAAGAAAIAGGERDGN